jgi:hypothetical protein
VAGPANHYDNEALRLLWKLNAAALWINSVSKSQRIADL